MYPAPWYVSQGEDMIWTRRELREATEMIVRLLLQVIKVTERKDNNAKPVEDGKFVALIHPDSVFDLEGDSNITNVWHYGGAGEHQSQIFDTTFKDLPLGFRLYESSIVPITRASGYGDVYHTFVLGAEAYGTAKLETMPAQIIVHLPGESGVADPLDQVATVGKCPADVKPIKFRGTPRRRTILSQARQREGATTRRWGLRLVA